MIGQTVTVVPSSGAYDADGDPVVDDPAAAEIDIEGCAVAPRFSSAFGSGGEPTARGRDGVLIGYTIYAPPGTVVAFADRIRINGVLYDVDGEPGTWTSPFTGDEKGVEIQVKRSEG